MKNLPLILIAAGFTAIHLARFQTPLMSLWLGIGLAIGLGLYILDNVVLSRYYADPAEGVSYPVTRTALMLVAYWPLTIYVIYSTTSLLGKGIVLGLGLTLSWDVWAFHRPVETFKQYFHFPARSSLTQLEITIASVVWSVVFILLAGSQLIRL